MLHTAVVRLTCKAKMSCCCMQITAHRIKRKHASSSQSKLCIRPERWLLSGTCEGNQHLKHVHVCRAFLKSCSVTPKKIVLARRSNSHSTLRRKCCGSPVEGILNDGLACVLRLVKLQDTRKLYSMQHALTTFQHVMHGLC